MKVEQVEKRRARITVGRHEVYLHEYSVGGKGRGLWLEFPGGYALLDLYYVDEEGEFGTELVLYSLVQDDEALAQAQYKEEGTRIVFSSEAELVNDPGFKGRRKGVMGRYVAFPARQPHSEQPAEPETETLADHSDEVDVQNEMPLLEGIDEQL